MMIIYHYKLLIFWQKAGDSAMRVVKPWRLNDDDDGGNGGGDDGGGGGGECHYRHRIFQWDREAWARGSERHGSSWQLDAASY